MPAAIAAVLRETELNEGSKTEKRQLVQHEHEDSHSHGMGHAHTGLQVGQVIGVSFMPRRCRALHAMLECR